MTINDKLREIRIKHNLKQDEFADSIGVSRETLACYENGFRTPSMEVIKCVCEVYNIPYESIYEDSTENNRKSKAGVKYLCVTLLISIVLIIAMLTIHFVNINSKYGYNIYNDELKVKNCSDICIVKVNYLEEDNTSEKIYNVSCIENFKNYTNQKYYTDVIIIRNNLIKVEYGGIYFAFNNISFNNILDIKVDYQKYLLIEDKPFIIELKDYDESLKYDNQEGKCKNIIDYYVNLIQEQKK